jgi:hypothetical protein
MRVSRAEDDVIEAILRFGFINDLLGGKDDEIDGDDGDGGLRSLQHEHSRKQGIAELQWLAHQINRLIGCGRDFDLGGACEKLR